MHQDKGADVNLKALRHFCHGIHKQFAISIVDNDMAPLVSPGQDVIQRPFIFNSPCTSHRRFLTKLS
jgi:hypothetical protein